MSNSITRRLTAPTPEGFLIATATTSRGYFSVTGEHYASRATWENGGEPHSCGCLHDDIGAALPQLEPLIALHLSSVDGGEDMHAVANAVYRLDPAGDYGHCMARRNAGQPDSYYFSGSADELATRILGFVADAMRCTVDDLPDRAEPWFVTEWANQQRDRWRREARAGLALLESLADDAGDNPADEIGEECTVTLDGLTARATCTDESFDDIGGHYVFTVKVTDDARHSYTAEYRGSAADYADGAPHARQAAIGVLSELTSALSHDSGEEMADEFGMDWHDMPAEQRRAFSRLVSASKRLEDALTANMMAIGC